MYWIRHFEPSRPVSLHTQLTGEICESKTSQGFLWYFRNTVFIIYSFHSLCVTLTILSRNVKEAEL